MGVLDSVEKGDSVRIELENGKVVMRKVIRTSKTLVFCYDIRFKKDTGIAYGRYRDHEVRPKATPASEMEVVWQKSEDEKENIIQHIRTAPLEKVDKDTLKVVQRMILMSLERNGHA